MNALTRHSALFLFAASFTAATSLTATASAQDAPATPEAPAAEAPAAEAPAAEAPAEEAPAAEAPAEEAPAAEAPAAEAPAEEAPAAEAPAAEAPAAEAPAEEAPAEEAPAEEAPAEEEEAKPMAGYDGGFFLRSPDDMFKLKVNGRVQTRLTYERLDGVDDVLNFSIPRARLGFKGHVFSKHLTYKFQVDFGKGFASLKDAYLNYKMHDWVHIRAGQFKKPYSRHQLTSSAKLGMVDRAGTDKTFGAGRDLGVMVHNNFAASPKIEYAVGVFNGSGDKSSFSGTADADGNVSGQFSNVPGQMEPVLVARVGYNHGGIDGYSEVDFEGGGFRAAVGAGAQMWLDVDDDDNGAAAANVDLMLKMKRATVSGAFYSMWNQRTAADENTSWTDQEQGSMGFHVQGSYLIKDKYAPVIRYAKVMNEGDDNDTQEILGGLGFYPYGHKVKVQADGGALMAEQAGGESSTDYLVRVQGQLSF